jgi:hypothetical protein
MVAFLLPCQFCRYSEVAYCLRVYYLKGVKFGLQSVLECASALQQVNFRVFVQKIYKDRGIGSTVLCSGVSKVRTCCGLEEFDGKVAETELNVKKMRLLGCWCVRWRREKRTKGWATLVAFI